MDEGRKGNTQNTFCLFFFCGTCSGCVLTRSYHFVATGQPLATLLPTVLNSCRWKSAENSCNWNCRCHTTFNCNKLAVRGAKAALNCTAAFRGWQGVEGLSGHPRGRTEYSNSKNRTNTVGGRRIGMSHMGRWQTGNKVKDKFVGKYENCPCNVHTWREYEC